MTDIFASTLIEITTIPATVIAQPPPAAPAPLPQIDPMLYIAISMVAAAQLIGKLQRKIDHVVAAVGDDLFDEHAVGYIAKLCWHMKEPKAVIRELYLKTAKPLVVHRTKNRAEVVITGGGQIDHATLAA